MNDFSEIRSGFEKRMEDLIIDIESVKRPDGLLTHGRGGARVMISDFNLWMEAVEKSYNSTDVVMVPGGSENDD